MFSFIRLSLLCVLTLWLFSGCAGTTPGSSTLDDKAVDRASTLFQQAQADKRAGDLDSASLRLTDLINNYSAYSRMDEVLYLAGGIELELARYDRSAAYYRALIDRYPLSTLRSAAGIGAARALSELGMYFESAETLSELLESPLDAETRDIVETELMIVVRRDLSPSQLEKLAQKYPSSPANREIAVNLARQEYARGDYDKAYTLLAEYLYRFPEESETNEARRLLKLAAEKRQPPIELPPGLVEPNTVGAVLPVTGPASLYGRYFDEGLRMAVDEFNQNSSRQIKLKRADSRGTLVGAVKAVRKLVLEDGAVGMVGAVFTGTTLAAAVEANAWRAPLLSPVVAADGLLEVGPWVFETKIPQEVEVAAVADLAVTYLMLERIAIVAPERGRLRAVSDLFAGEINRLGAEVVSTVYYEEGATDFREQLETVRESAPDAIFIPGDVKDLLNLLPQVKFYDLQIQLLGLSNWNDDNLLRLFGRELEGALFPLEVYRGKDPEAYDRLKIALKEKGSGEVNPVTVAGYFGMHLLLEALAAGASNREEVREYLDGELNRGSEQRISEAGALTILTVRSGEIREYTRPTRPQTGF
jgi:ABC-type branched-subunit amino acid transport system substrate-binding protein